MRVLLIGRAFDGKEVVQDTVKVEKNEAIVGFRRVVVHNLELFGRGGRAEVDRKRLPVCHVVV